MSKRLQVLMDEEEHEEIREAAAARRLTVSAWVRQVLREARKGSEAGPPPPGAAAAPERPVAPDPSGASSPFAVDDELVDRLMELYRFSSREAAVHFALRRAADSPLPRDEILGLRGSGWSGDLDLFRAPRPQGEADEGAGPG